MTLDEQLLDAAIAGDLKAAKKLFNENGSLPSNRDQALVAASAEGHVEMVRFLLDRGADIHAGMVCKLLWPESDGYILEFLANDDGWALETDQALTYAAQFGKKEVVELLLERGADVHAGSGQPLLVAAYFGKLEILRILLKHGAEGITEDFKCCILRWAAAGGHCDVVDELVDLLFKDGAKPSLLDYPIETAAFAGREAVVKQLLGKGADIHFHEDGPLRYAAQNGHLPVVKLLLERGIDVNTVTDVLEDLGPDDDAPEVIDSSACQNVEYRAIDDAAEYGHFDIVRFLLEQGSVLPVDLDGTLAKAIKSHDFEFFKFLLENGADVQKALYSAAIAGHRDAVEFAISKGADIHADDERALREAVINGSFFTLYCLVKHGANVQALAKDNYQTIHEAAKKGKSSVIEFLLEKGLDPVIGEKALKEAYENELAWLVKTLKEPNSKD